MADKITETKTLTMVASFYDGDTRTITQTDPKAKSELPTLITNFVAYVKENNVLIGDKAGAPFKELTEAKLVTKTVTLFDLG